MFVETTSDPTRYPFVVTPDPDAPKEWLVIFPDLEGCMGYADSIEDVGSAANAALADWMAAAEEFGDSIPQPNPSAPVTMPEWALAAFPTRLPSLTAEDVAEVLGISARRVRAIAQSRGVGERFNRTIMFFDEDIERLRPNKPGRPIAV